MGCSLFDDLFANLEPGEDLPEAISAHLYDCVQCRRAHTRDLAVWELLGEYQAPPAPTDLLANIERVTAADELTRRRSRSSWSRFAVAAAAVVCLGVTIGAWLGNSAEHRRAAVAPAAPTLRDHAQIFDVAPPGSLTDAYAALEANR